jgi:hypothetical protein
VTAGAVPPHPPGAVWLEPGDGGAVLHLRGEVDAAPVARWDQDRSSPGVDGAPHGAVVAVDASAAAFLNSAGVALLVRETGAHRRGRRATRAAPPLAGGPAGAAADRGGRPVRRRDGLTAGSSADRAGTPRLPEHPLQALEQVLQRLLELRGRLVLGQQRRESAHVRVLVQ